MDSTVLAVSRLGLFVARLQSIRWSGLALVDAFLFPSYSRTIRRDGQLAQQNRPYSPPQILSVVPEEGLGDVRSVFRHYIFLNEFVGKAELRAFADFLSSE